MAKWYTNIFKTGSRNRSGGDSSAISAEERNVASSSLDKPSEELLRLLGASNIKVAVTPQNAMGIATFYGCVRFISESIASLPFQVKYAPGEKGGKVVYSHPLSWVLGTKPNKNMSPYEARRAMLVNLLVFGWSVSEIKRNAKREVVEIIPYPCGQVSILHDQLSDTYFFQIPHLGKVLEQDDVIFLKGLGTNGSSGGSLLNWQHQTLKINLLGKSFQQKFFEKSTFVGGIIHSGATLVNEEQAKTTKKRFVEALQEGDDGGFGIAVLAQGNTFTKVGMTPVESQLAELFNHSSKEIAMMFGLPLSVLGNTEVQSSWGSGVEQMYIGVKNSVFAPLAVQIEQEINYKCFRKDEILSGYFTAHDFKALLKGDLKSQAEYFSKMSNAGLRTPDEIRDFDDLEPYPDGTGARAYMQGAMRPLNLLGVEHNKKDSENVNGDQGASSGSERGEGDNE